MINRGMRQIVSDEDSNAAVAEFIRTKGVTRCPTACVLPTQGAVAMADQLALEEYAARRDRLRRVRMAARIQQFWSVETVRPLGE
jgi:hypothetical protein